MERLLQKLFENSNHIVLITDESFNIRYVSSAVEQTFNISPYNLLGRNAFDFVHPEKRDEWRQCLWNANNNKSDEIFLTTKSGKEFHFDVTVSNLIQHEHIRGLVIILHDITKRAQAHFELTQANQHLGEFIFKTSHDLKAPLNSALGLLTLAEASSEEDRARYLQLTQATLQKMNNLIDELNRFHEVEKMAVLSKPIDSDSFFSQEIDLLRNQPGAHGIQFQLDINASSQLYSDPVRMQSIFTNILSNSIKYMDPAKQEKFIRINVNVDVYACSISVQDNGIGIKRKHLEQIFEKFFRVNREIEGTGLGLHIVKDTLRRIGGSIEVQSEHGKGTTFLIHIPNFISQLRLA
jgi:hypothetical protein